MLLLQPFVTQETYKQHQLEGQTQRASQLYTRGEAKSTSTETACGGSLQGCKGPACQVIWTGGLCPQLALMGK